MSIKTILVEDNATIVATLVPTMAELADLEVVSISATARDGVSALSRLSEFWELAVVDLFLKQGTGLDVLRACRIRRKHQVVVVLSNYPTEQVRRECKALGADAFFDKSTELDAFFSYCIARFH